MMSAKSLIATLFVFYFVLTLTFGLPPSTKLHHSCPESIDFDCGSARCIPGYWHCDNVIDCYNGIDEHDCNYLHNCSTGEFMCRNSYCISPFNKCNGIDDCGDGSDELGCEYWHSSVFVSARDDYAHQLSDAHHEKPMASKMSWPSLPSFPHENINDKVPEELECDCKTELGGSSTASLFLVLLMFVGAVMAVIFIAKQVHTRNKLICLDSSLKELNTNLSEGGFGSPTNVHISPSTRSLSNHTRSQPSLFVVGEGQ